MAESSPHTRTSRSRRAIALMAWALLIITAVFLWDARQSGTLTMGASPISASLLASFGAFVAVFAWMLFNANHRRNTDSFAAAAATLFPPPIIAFSLISSESPLRWWMAFGIAMLVIIAILSHVPDEFFGVPRGRSSYVVPLPIFDRMENGVLDPNASWFTFNDLSQIVPDTERPSLAPRAYLNQDSEGRSTGPSVSTYGPARPNSSVDDILGTDYDIGLLDDSLMDLELNGPPISSFESTDAARYSRPQTSSLPAEHTTESRQPLDSRSSQSQERRYQFNSTSRHLTVAASKRREKVRNANFRHRLDRKGRHAATITRDESNDRRFTIERSSTASFHQTDSSAPAPNISAAFLASESAAQEIRGRERSSSKTDRTRSAESKSTQQRSNTQQRPEIHQPASHVRNEVPATPAQDPVRKQPASPSTRGKSRTSESAPAKAYFQETNQHRGDRYRAQSKAATPSARKTPSQPIDGESSGRSQATGGLSTTGLDSNTSSTPRRGGTIFGVPLPFGIGSSDADADVASQPIEQIDRIASENSVSESAFRETVDEAQQKIQEFRSSGLDVPAESVAPVKEKRRSRYDDTAEVETPRRGQPFSAPPQSTESGPSEATHFERTKDEHGSELVEGVMTIRFDKGQKRANLHIPFSPPLPGMPEVECECVGDVPLRLKVPVRQSYGIRIEARRTNADEALDADVGFAAVYSPE